MSELVFISYGREDAGVAKLLVDKLKSNGLRPWLDEYELTPEADWVEQTRQALIASQTLIVILSERPTSPGMLVEAGAAIANNALIIPLAIGKNVDIELFHQYKPVYVGDECEFGQATAHIINRLGAVNEMVA
jgi:hypothetical protein